MIKKEYCIIDSITGECLAKGMDLDMALAFIKGIYSLNFNEHLDLRIKEENAQMA